MESVVEVGQTKFKRSLTFLEADYFLEYPYYHRALCTCSPSLLIIWLGVDA